MDELRSPVEEYLERATFHAQRSRSGIGATVTRSTFENGERIWDCVVTDGREWRYIRVLGDDVGPFPDISSEDIKEAIDRFADTLPADYRLRHLLSANPLHLSRDGEVHD